MISIYTPTYNRANILLDRAIRSVLNQTYTNWEYIIIGDCCTDSTEQVIKELNNPRIKFYNMPERVKNYPKTAENHWLVGPVDAANKALEMVTGDYIARIDDDEIWSQYHLQRSLEYLQKHHLDFVSAKNIEVRDGIEQEAKAYRAHSKYYGFEEDDDNSPTIGATSTWVYKSELKKFKYDPNCWKKKWNRVNDIDISQRMYQSGVKMGFIAEVHCKTLPRPGESDVGFKAYQTDYKNKEVFYG